jgi:hypothetical protein
VVGALPFIIEEGAIVPGFYNMSHVAIQHFNYSGSLSVCKADVVIFQKKKTDVVF